MIKPVLHAMVLADHVYQDRRSGKSVIAGTFTKIVFQPNTEEQEPIIDPDTTVNIQDAVDGKKPKTYPAFFDMGSPHMYLALSGVRNDIVLEIRLVDLADAKVLMEGEMPITVKVRDPVAVIEVAVPLPRLPIPRKAGHYSVDLLWHGEQLGAWRIDAVIPKNEAYKEQGSSDDSNS